MTLRRIFNSPLLLLATFLVTMLTASTAYALTEGEGLVNALYWSVVTATTLGYGDFSPHSAGGKLATSLLIMFTVFVMIPAITANIASWLIVNRDAFTHEEQEDIKAALRELVSHQRARLEGESYKKAEVN